MRLGFFAFAIIMLSACSKPVTMGEWPAVVVKRTVLEQVALGGRRVMIEQVPRFLVAGKSGRGIPNADSSYDQYLFWDWCRGGGMPWQMVVLRPDGHAHSGWSYTNTLLVPGHDGYSGETKVTEGRLAGTISNYAALRAAGLAFFKPKDRACNKKTADWDGA